jgi:Ser/Thr protein kinase RdoA (MazF antagonist)
VTEVPTTAAMAARAFGLDPGLLHSLGGASGSAWGIGRHVLRVGQPAVIAAEEAASRAAAAVVPVPRILDRADLGPSSAVLLERLPGCPAVELARLRPDLAAAAGRACGAVHARLAGIRAPAGLWAAPEAPPSPDPRLLHLDLHPFNILVNGQGELTGVLDWANAAAGDAVLDRART